jgi:predicted outer membrane repeat protein
MSMSRLMLTTSIVSASLIAALLVAPAPVRGAAGTDFYISDIVAGDVGTGTSCADTDFQYDADDGLNAALQAVYEDDDFDSGDTITLCDIDATDGEVDYVMTGDVSIDGDATLDLSDVAAPGQLTIRGDADDADSIVIDANDGVGDDDGGYAPFDFTDADVTITNLTILNAWDDSAGAAIHHIEADATDGMTLTLDTVTIEYAYASGDGAGVWSAGDVIVINSTFEDNGIGGVIDGDGAAIYALGSVDVTDSTFDGNYANVEGGAIWSDADVTIAGSTFVGNWTDKDEDGEGEDTATGEEGGAVYASGDVVVSDSVFTDNNAPMDGGAIWAQGSVSIEEGSLFDDNVSGGIGGALYVGPGDLHVSDSTFTGNSADEGGAINHDFGDALTEIIGSTFTDNVADGSSGGAIHTEGDIAVSRSRFYNNSTVGDDPDDDDDGGAIHVGGSGHSSVTASIFRENYSQDSGGALYLDGCESAVISGSTFTDNEAFDSGGAVNNACQNEISVVEVTRNTFTGNVAHSYGGAMDNDAADGALVIYKSNTFLRNSVLWFENEDQPGEGGALWVYSGRFSGNTFRSNRALGCGGAVYLSTTDFNTLKSGRNKFSSNRGTGSRRTWDVCR